MSVVPPCCALAAIFTRASLNILEALAAPCNAFKYAFPALISCLAPGLNFSRIFWKIVNKNICL